MKFNFSPLNSTLNLSSACKKNVEYRFFMFLTMYCLWLTKKLQPRDLPKVRL